MMEFYGFNERHPAGERDAVCRIIRPLDGGIGQCSLGVQRLS